MHDFYGNGSKFLLALTPSAHRVINWVCAHCDVGRRWQVSLRFRDENGEQKVEDER